MRKFVVKRRGLIEPSDGGCDTPFTGQERGLRIRALKKTIALHGKLRKCRDRARILWGAPVEYVTARVEEAIVQHRLTDDGLDWSP